MVLALERPPTTTIRSTSPAASSVSCWRRIVTGQTVLTILSSWARETMKAASRSNFQGGWVDCEMSAIRLRRGMAASHSSSSSTTIASGAKPSRPTTSGCFGRAEQDDGVAVLDEPDELALLLDDPGAGAVDDLEAALLGALHDVRADAVGADDDGGAVVDVVERFDRLDAEILEVADDALVVDDLAEGMRRLAGGRRLLRLVDRLANAVAEAGALRDADFLDHAHGPIIARGPFGPARQTSVAAGDGAASRWVSGSARPYGPRCDGGRRAAIRSMISVVARRFAVRRSMPGGQLVGEAERAPDADRDVAARVRQLLALRPDAVRPGDRERDDRGAGPQCEDGDAVLRLLQRPVRAARALREDEQDVALVEDPLREPEGLDVGRATVDGWTPPLAAVQPTIGQSNSSFLPSQWIRRPSLGISHEPITMASRLDAWFAARMSGPSRGISSTAPSSADPAHRPAEDPATEASARR